LLPLNLGYARYTVSQNGKARLRLTPWPELESHVVRLTIRHSRLLHTNVRPPEDDDDVLLGGNAIGRIKKTEFAAGQTRWEWI
jgi:hypothetical protein